MRHCFTLAVLWLLATPAFAQQSQSETGASESLKGTVAPGSAATGGQEIGKGTETTLQSTSTNVPFKRRFAAAAPDGKLTLAQAKAAKMPNIVRNFSSIDAQRNGYVTYDEIVEWFTERQNPPSVTKGH